MDRTKLREAIEYWKAFTEPGWMGGSSLRLVHAAACAYACERCGGTGESVDFVTGEGVPCPDCAGFRRIADGGGE